MDALQFISSIVGSLVWPLTLLAAVVLLRNPLSELLPSLRSMKYDKFQIEFGRQLEKAEAGLSNLPPATIAPSPTDKTSDERFEAAASLTPNLAVLQAWLDVEAELKAAATKAGLDFRRSSPLDAARTIQRAGLIDDQTVELILELRNLRNLVVHPDEKRPITVEQAQRYKSVADRIIAALRSPPASPSSGPTVKPEKPAGRAGVA